MKLTNLISHILFLHLFTYFRSIKNKILDKGEKLIYDHLPQISSEEMIYDIPPQRDLSKWQLSKIIFFGKLRYKTIYILSLYILESACRNITSIIMSILIRNIIQHSEDYYKYAIILLIVQAIANLSRHHSITKSMEFSAKARFTLLNLLYKKVLTLEGEVDMGKIISLATSDISMLEYYFMLIFQIFVVPLSFVFGSIILYLRFDGIIGLAGIGIITLVYPIQLLIQRKSISFTRAGKEKQDQRIKQTNEFVEGIRVIQMQTWEDVFIKNITKARMEEQQNYMDNLKYQAIDRSFNCFAQIWGSCIFFIVLYYNGYNLNVQDMISTIQLLQYFKSNGVQQVSYGIQSVLNINLTFSRLLNILNINNKQKQRKQQLINTDYILQLNNYSQNSIKNLYLTLQQGEFIVITGNVGSGKSTILKAILKQQNNSCIQKDNLTKGYVEQEPFLFSDTIRNNIIFGRPFLEELYFNVIKATCLDIDINKMQQKDQTIVGDKGSTLSGGQKQRISLARALYSMPDLYLLDDPFSAIDQNVANQIYQKALIEFLYTYQPTQTNKRPSVILVTHQINIIQKCLNVFQLKNGQLTKLNQNLDDISIDTQTDQFKNELTKQTNNKIIEQGQIEKIQNIEQNRYLRYFKYNNQGYTLIIIVIIMNISSEVLYNVYYHLIAQFYEFQQNNRINLLFIILGGLCLLAFLTNLSKYILNSYECLNQNTQIHHQMLQSIGQGQIKYFDSNLPSQILTKFSMDLNIADTMINSTLYDLWELGSYFITSLVALVILEPYFIFFMIITILLNYYVFNYLKNIIISTKEVDLTTRSQIIDLFRKSVNGLEIIKVYEQEDWFKKQFVQLSNQCIVSNVTFYYAQRIFAFCIDLIGFLIQGIGLYVMVSLNSSQSEIFVQALLLLIIFNENQQWFLRQFLSFGSYMNSVSRMFELIDQKRQPNQNKNPSFAPQGQLMLKNVYLKYSDEYALKGFNLNVQRGEKIGIVGRTGAGKSSIIQMLFRMYEVERAEQLEIDCFDIRSLSLKQLRQSIGIIPQNPLIFEGSLKYNLDPYNQYKDEDLLIIIKQVGLNQKFKLTDQLMNLSIGEKQLVCLARILISDKRIIILDEATASVDNQTNQLIQKLIKSYFKDRTILTIAHRMYSFSEYDRIIEVVDGQVKDK